MHRLTRSLTSYITQNFLEICMSRIFSFLLFFNSGIRKFVKMRFLFSWKDVTPEANKKMWRFRKLSKREVSKWLNRQMRSISYSYLLPTCQEMSKKNEKDPIFVQSWKIIFKLLSPSKRKHKEAKNFFRY